MKKLFGILGVALGAIMMSVNPAMADINICTGAEGGGYHNVGAKIGGMVRSRNKVDVNILFTNGTLDNIERFNDGECDIAIVQEDGLNVSKPTRPFKSKPTHEEAVYWLYNLENGVKDLADIEGQEDEYAIVIVEGSGSDVTMRNFVIEDGGYKGLYDTAYLAEEFYFAAEKVSDGQHTNSKGKRKVAGMVYVTRAGAISNEVVQDFGRNLGIGEMTDGDFNDAKTTFGDDLYRDCEIKSEHTKGLEKSVMFGSMDTICMNAVVIFSTEEMDGVSYRDISRSINKALR